METVGKLS